MADKRDGGLWALGGYLYQIVGTLGIAVRAQNLRDSETPEDQLDILFDLFDKVNVPNLNILVEQYGEDALICGIEPIEGAVFVQFKYSRKVPPSPLGKAEIDDIFRTFDRNFQRARNAGVNVQLCVLITNRPFVAGEGHGEDTWQVEEQKKRGYKIRRILNETFDDFEKKIEIYGREYGASDDEITRGINMLIGKLLRSSAGEISDYNPSDFQAELRESFTNSNAAHPIRLEDLSHKCLEELKAFGTNQLGLENWDFSPIRRDKYLEALVKLVSTRALIAICGPGGTGKSVLLWHLLYSNSGYCLYKMDLGSNIRSRWIQKLINQEWRNLPDDKCPAEDENQAIKRVVRANEKRQKPILWLGLDGIDEGMHLADQQAQLQELIRTFWKYDSELQTRGTPSNAALIITSRQQNDIVRLLGISPDLYSNQIELIQTDEFDDNELKLGLLQKFPERLSDPRIFSFGSQSFPENPSYLDQSILVPPTPAIDPLIRGVLKTPLIWRVLLRLGNDMQRAVLDGEQEALARLAEGVLSWFQHKAKNRNLNLNSQQNLIYVISQIARQTNTERNFSLKEWSDCIATDYGMSVAHLLYKEAESSGIIDFPAHSTWRWKHSFIHQYLAEYQG